MPYDLEGLENRFQCIKYASTEGRMLRKSEVVEEQVSFLVKWSTELYGEWATWLMSLIPGCKVRLRTDTVQIAEEIKDMLQKGQIKRK